MVVRQEQVVERLKSGETLLVTLPCAEQDKRIVNLSGGGRVGVRTYDKLRDQLEPDQPGLFEDSEPQTWRWSDG